MDGIGGAHDRGIGRQACAHTTHTRQTVRSPLGGLARVISTPLAAAFVDAGGIGAVTVRTWRNAGRRLSRQHRGWCGLGDSWRRRRCRPAGLTVTGAISSLKRPAFWAGLRPYSASRRRIRPGPGVICHCRAPFPPCCPCDSREGVQQAVLASWGRSFRNCPSSRRCAEGAASAAPCSSNSGSRRRPIVAIDTVEDRR